ncbi:hypothetical protein LX32DRAFT_221413 [Colletotrichum zoysiae]|uniref:Uncharacterized protein n=1 Tax=Colletotrichum zoysiae TaxID=1216348 RepID=A0AAD9LVF9_9PEZI|nr:hypothetical protein LX32DRAFT_221413 [Colletotrichum zoysiae]
MADGMVTRQSEVWHGCCERCVESRNRDIILPTCCRLPEAKLTNLSRRTLSKFVQQVTHLLSKHTPPSLPTSQRWRKKHQEHVRAREEKEVQLGNARLGQAPERKQPIEAIQEPITRWRWASTPVRKLPGEDGRVSSSDHLTPPAPRPPPGEHKLAVTLWKHQHLIEDRGSSTATMAIFANQPR